MVVVGVVRKPVRVPVRLLLKRLGFKKSDIDAVVRVGFTTVEGVGVLDRELKVTFSDEEV